MKTEQVKRGLIIPLIIVGGIAGLIVDHGLEDQPRALAQMILWTTLLLAFLLIQLHESLRRPIQLLIATALTGIHVCLLILFRSHFPLRNMIIGFVGMAIEGIIFVFLYARIGQWLDPKGPFGMTDAEREVRSLKRRSGANYSAPNNGQQSTSLTNNGTFATLRVPGAPFMRSHCSVSSHEWAIAPSDPPLFTETHPCRSQNAAGVTIGYFSASANKSLSPVIR